MQYDCVYDNDGNGCVSFVDVDSKQYIYTQFESYYANRVFPCFDQPDLKAKMRLGVICPSNWKKVLSNEHPLLEKEITPEEYLQLQGPSYPDELRAFLGDKAGRATLFPETKLLPSYLYCFIAGEYLELQLEEERRFKVVVILGRTFRCPFTALSPSTNP